jgi:hypothetical protein
MESEGTKAAHGADCDEVELQSMRSQPPTQATPSRAYSVVSLTQEVQLQPKEDELEEQLPLEPFEIVEEAIFSALRQEAAAGHPLPQPPAPEHQLDQQHPFSTASTTAETVDLTQSQSAKRLSQSQKSWATQALSSINLSTSGADRTSSSDNDYDFELCDAE